MKESQTFTPTIAILGGGPAGMGCALWLKHMGLAPIIIEKTPSLGGLAGGLDRINRWFLGQQDRTSMEIANTFAKHIVDEDIPVRFSQQPVGLTHSKTGTMQLAVESGGRRQNLAVQALVIATGNRAVGAEAFQDIAGWSGIRGNPQLRFFPIDHLPLLDHDQLKHKHVAVFGGGDNAYCTANDVAASAKAVYLIMRSRPRAQQRFQAALETHQAQGAIAVYPDARVIRFSQRGTAIDITLATSDQQTLTISADWIFVRLGFVPVLGFLASLPALNGIKQDPAGYILTDAETRTSIPFVYAIGDVTGYQPASLITAVAQGAAAARAIEMDFRPPVDHAD